MKTSSVRPVELSDLQVIMSIIEDGRATMRADGNINQWTKGYPSEETVRADIMQRHGFAVLGDSGTVKGYFAFIQGVEPTYLKICGGAWLNDAEYGVIHRMAAKSGEHGIFAAALDFALSRIGNIRIDTHRDNKIMQHNILKHGFRYCGIIYLASGDERLAYQLVRES